ncbi:unnamed protein product [Trichobilharzia regenti]|nr:unnamed protein product [Trichobilharzia regenti]
MVNMNFRRTARRDPSKRQIKPVNTDHLALLDDIDDDSDSEYICEEVEDDDGDGDDDEPATGHVFANSSGVKTKDVDIMICMLCLGDGVDLNDELIECDGCGIVVHEGENNSIVIYVLDCYKVVDSIFLSSGASSSSTDAWFCEPCLAGVTSPVKRERKIMEISKHISTLQNTQRELQIADASASHSYNSITAELEKLVTQRGGLFVKFSHIVSTLRNLIPGLKLSCELENVLSEHSRPVETSTLDVSSSDPVDSNRSIKFGSSAVIAASKRKRPFSPSSKVRKVSKSETSDQNTAASKNAVASHVDSCSGVKFEPESVILECTVCHGLQDQHLITSCDACGKAFHLACLDPPLLRMPKRSKIYSCDTIDVNAPRQLRRSGGIPSSKTTCVKLEDKKVSIPKDSSICKSEVDPNLQMPVSNPTISAENKSPRVTSRSAASRHEKSLSSVGAKSSLASPVSKGGKKKSSGVLKKSLSSKCKSLLSNRRTQRRVSTSSKISTICISILFLNNHSLHLEPSSLTVYSKQCEHYIPKIIALQSRL